MLCADLKKWIILASLSPDIQFIHNNIPHSLSYLTVFCYEPAKTN